MREAFQAYGFEPEVAADYGRRSGGVLPWIITVVVTTPVVAFFAAIGTAAGQDTYAAVKKWAKDMWASRTNSPASRGFLEIEDTENTRVILASDLPDEALDALVRLDWEEHRGEYLIWDDGTWRDPTRR